jgi:hypothetical protein
MDVSTSVSTKSMASILKKPHSRFWFAAFRDSNGKQCRKSTGETNERKARAIAMNYERAARLGRVKGQRTMTPKRFAHYAVARAIEQGSLIRKPCEVCGDDCADAHHDDYDWPLDVRFLCAKHHKQFHVLAVRRKLSITHGQSPKKAQ